MNNPEAVFDALFIGRGLQQKLEDFSQYEIQFFAYFGCLMSLYDGHAVDEWKYSFVKTELGSPYSSDIAVSIQTLCASGFFEHNSVSKDYFRITAKGEAFLNFQSENLSMFSSRMKYLETVCKTISLIPLGNIKEGIGKEPVLLSAGNSLTKKSLLEDSNPATRALYAQFKELKIALEDKFKDLLVPAVVWLESLNIQNV